MLTRAQTTTTRAKFLVSCLLCRVCVNISCKFSIIMHFVHLGKQEVIQRLEYRFQWRYKNFLKNWWCLFVNNYLVCLHFPFDGWQQLFLRTNFQDLWSRLLAMKWLYKQIIMSNLSNSDGTSTSCHSHCVSSITYERHHAGFKHHIAVASVFAVAEYSS